VPGPLDYATRERRSWSIPRRGAKRIVIALIALLGTTLISLPDAYTVEHRVDAVTGSETFTTRDALGRVRTRILTSPLEVRLKQLGVSWTPRLDFMHLVHHNWFGNARGFGCGTAPPIFQMRSCLGLLDAAYSDDEVRVFARVMEFGTEAEQQAAINVASKRLFP
jgi:hypothetical protein